MKITEILIIIVNASIFVLPAIMLIDNLINGKYRILNICMLLLKEIRHMWLSVRLMWRDVWRY